MGQPILPDVHVDLIGQDGNAMFIMARVTKAMKRAGHGDRVSEYTKEAMSGDYNNVLSTTMKWVSTD